MKLKICVGHRADVSSSPSVDLYLSTSKPLVFDTYVRGTPLSESREGTVRATDAYRRS
jgi:hypothetical protein